ncbi:MAG: glycosyltransferase [Betaproteobacteria bacterium]|nr:glycosyltransferase [Betaproteobacteria bacterium]
MHITFVIQDLYRLGAQYVTSLIMKGLVRRGHRVDLILSAVQEKLARERPDLVPFPIPREVAVFNLPNERASRNVRPVAAYLRAQHPDIIVPIGTYVLPVAIASWLTGSTAKLVPVEHSSGIGVKDKDSHTDFKDGNVNYKPSIARRLIIAILTALFEKRTTHVIAVSNGEGCFSENDGVRRAFDNGHLQPGRRGNFLRKEVSTRISSMAIRQADSSDCRSGVPCSLQGLRRLTQCICDRISAKALPPNTLRRRAETSGAEIACEQFGSG